MKTKIFIISALIMGGVLGLLVFAPISSVPDVSAAEPQIKFRSGTDYWYWPSLTRPGRHERWEFLEVMSPKFWEMDVRVINYPNNDLVTYKLTSRCVDGGGDIASERTYSVSQYPWNGHASFSGKEACSGLRAGFYWPQLEIVAEARGQVIATYSHGNIGNGFTVFGRQYDINLAYPIDGSYIPPVAGNPNAGWGGKGGTGLYAPNGVDIVVAVCDSSAYQCQNTNSYGTFTDMQLNYAIDCDGDREPDKTGSARASQQRIQVQQGLFVPAWSNVIRINNACRYDKPGKYRMEVKLTNLGGYGIERSRSEDIYLYSSGPVPVTIQPQPVEAEVGVSRVSFNAKVDNLTPPPLRGAQGGDFSLKLYCSQDDQTPEVTTGYRSDYQREGTASISRSVGTCEYSKAGLQRVRVEFSEEKELGPNPDFPRDMWPTVKGEGTADVYVTGLVSGGSSFQTETPSETGVSEITENFYLNAPASFYFDWRVTPNSAQDVCTAYDRDGSAQGKWGGAISYTGESGQVVELGPGFYQYDLECAGPSGTTRKVNKLKVGGLKWSAVLTDIDIGGAREAWVLVDGSIVEKFDRGIGGEAARVRGTNTAKSLLPNFEPELVERGLTVPEVQEVIDELNRRYGGGAVFIERFEAREVQ